jgi:hypothetical protein
MEAMISPQKPLASIAEETARSAAEAAQLPSRLKLQDAMFWSMGLLIPGWVHGDELNAWYISK